MNKHPDPKGPNLKDDLGSAERSEGVRVALMWAGFGALVAIVFGLTMSFTGFGENPGPNQQASAPATSTAQ